MNVIFIAAGSGSRLGNLTTNLPKPLVSVNGKSIIERQVSLFQKNGIKNITIVVGPNKDKFHLEDVEYIYDDKHLEHDQLGSLMVASEKINGETLILFADIVFDEIILKQMLNSKCDIGIAIDLDWEKSYEERMDNPKAEADKVLLSKGEIKELSKEIKFGNNELQVGEFLGIIKLSSIGCEIFKKNCEEYYKKNNFNKEFLKQAKVLHILEEINLNKQIITPISIEGKWCEIDTPNDLAYAEKLFS
tara:strand:- start:1909 stop:2649 length:741 start_codon:yes stop_codon:yes gene_type:complete